MDYPMDSRRTIRNTQQHTPTTTTFPPHPHDDPFSFKALLRSFGYAFHGIIYVFRTQRNARIHALIGLCALALGWVVGITRWEWLALVLTCALVIVAESINTAIEAVVDLVTESYHPLAGIAKDVAAGAVLLCAGIAVVMGCIIFLPHLVPIVFSLLEV
jgi:diacylglycerol kinase (ATP)